jgi:FG-GAP-like repeat/Tetratricopeptide repeat
MPFSAVSDFHRPDGGSRSTRKALWLRSLFLVGVLVSSTLAPRHFIRGDAALRTTARAKVTSRAVAFNVISGVADAGPSGDLQRFRNLGKAYYEQGKYDDAVEQFEKVVGSGQAFATDHLNLGLALLEDNQLDPALGELTTAWQMDPKLLAARYALGVLYKHEQRYPDAEAELKHVAGADPSDPASWFNLGTVYFAEKRLPQALDAFQRVVQMGFGRAQNFYVAGTFHLFTILTRLGRTGEAGKYLKLNRAFRDKVPNISIQYPALEAGRYGVIVVPPATAVPSTARPAPAAPTFTDITNSLGIHLAAERRKGGESAEFKAREYSLDVARERLLPLFPPSIAIGDYDGDGYPDIYLVTPGGRSHLLRNNGKGSFTDVTEKAGVGGDSRGLSAVFADYDNSGHPSLFVAGLGGVRLYRNRGDGTFVDDTAKAGLAGKAGELDSKVIAFDSDNDGFLDLVVTSYTDLSAPPHRSSFKFPDDFEGAVSHLYRNNADGTFSDITATSGLASARGRMRSVVFGDFNDDGYADLVFLRDDAPPALYLNQGEDHFANASTNAGPDFARSVAVGADVADLNHDGKFDLVFWGPKGCRVLLGTGDAKFRAVDLPSLALPSGPFANTGIIADLDGDGFDDLVAVDASGRLQAVFNRAAHLGEVAEVSPERRSSAITLAAASLLDPGKLDLLTVDANGTLRVLEKQGPAARWASVKLDGSKSNKEGTGSIVEFKSGDFYKKVIATGGTVHIFTGPISKLDVVRVTWPNLIIENSIGMATDRSIEMRESERLASSCPFLYVWNGRRYIFLSDIMGVSPLGELAPDGTYVRPNPDQVVRLGSIPQSENGKLTFQITSEMRETDYFDQLRLFAVDHPSSEAVYANEIYSSTPVEPEIYLVHDKRFPVSAVDDGGQDVLPLLRDVDSRYPTGFRRDRVLGVADLHTLTLDLGPFPASADPALWLTGWVFWTDSNASRALLSNKQLSMTLPYLQVRDASGKWVTVIADMGLPSGDNRTFRVDLAGKFLSADHHVRIVTSLCVYWDQIFLSTGDRRLTNPLSPAESGAQQVNLSSEPDAREAELPLVSADLHYRGFSTPITDPHHLKPDDFDYTRLLAAAPWNPFGGRYTRYGPVEELVTRADDRLVVMAVGDEMTLSFDARERPAMPEGWQRDYFLYMRGYAKDGEPNTAEFRTSEPLPFYRMSSYPYATIDRYPDSSLLRQYLESYETRPAYRLVAPLAPPRPSKDSLPK